MNSSTRRSSLLAALLLVLMGAGASRGEEPAVGERFGVLVMAHGGTEEWNRAVEVAVERLESEDPIEIAFGMVDGDAMQEAVAKLEEAGARRIGVVRLFVSGDSWYERTRQVLGLSPGAPPCSQASTDTHVHASPGSGHRARLCRVESSASFALSSEGLSEAPEMDRILLERARELSRDPAREDLLVLAHGPGDDTENERWIADIRERTGLLEAELGFRRVEVMTLREDWSGKRKEAERQIRAYVERADADEGRALVVPFRVQGFGPYAEVLQGLDYESYGLGLLPHPAVSDWIDRQIEELEAVP